MIKIMIASPVHQKPAILKEFLQSLLELNTTNLELGFNFIDDNENIESSNLLTEFKNKTKNVFIENFNLSSDFSNEYLCDEFTHHWSNNLVDKLILFKNKLIKNFLNTDYDYLFFIDSDIVLHPSTLENLVNQNKNILSNIFWTKWNPNGQKLPQVWLKNSYTLYDADDSVQLSTTEAEEKTNEFINMLKKPGVYRVGGLGACTLISRKALAAGVNFSKIYNISFWGEDRYFCLRASVLGFELFVDTHYPAYHIYRDTDLCGVSDYKKQGKNAIFNIETHKLFDYISDVIIPLESFDYRDNKLSFKNEALSFEFNDLWASDKINSPSSEFICTPSISNFKVDFYDNGSLALSSFIMNYCGFKNGFSFNKSFEKKIVTRKISSGYIIDGYSTTKKIKNNNLNLIRRINKKPTLALSMVVKNEEGRFLEKALLSHKDYIDKAIIIDDNSTDNTRELVRDILGDKNLILIENKNSLFSNEINLRKLQWEQTIKAGGDWILNLDADEIFEDKFKDEIASMIENENVDAYLFRLFDFWNDKYYREDNLWNAHKTYRPFLIRYQSNYLYQWKNSSQHCGRFPLNVANLNSKISTLRLKHFGWSKEIDRIQKYNRYMGLDPFGKHGILAQYQSILDENPKLVKWKE